MKPMELQNVMFSYKILTGQIARNDAFVARNRQTNNELNQFYYELVVMKTYILEISILSPNMLILKIRQRLGFFYYSS